MKANRPVFLDIFKIHFPLAAIISILHRISGVALFLAMPFFVWALSLSLESANGFRQLTYLFAVPAVKVLVLLFLAAMWYHLCAGIRHLCMDFGMGESARAGYFSSLLTLVGSLALVLAVGVWLW